MNFELIIVNSLNAVNLKFIFIIDLLYNGGLLIYSFIG